MRVGIESAHEDLNFQKKKVCERKPFSTGGVAKKGNENEIGPAGIDRENGYD